MTVTRAALRLRVDAALKRSPVTALLGPRQCGKTDLRLKHLFVVYPGSGPIHLHDRVTAIPISAIAAGVKGLLRGAIQPASPPSLP